MSGNAWPTIPLGEVCKLKYGKALAADSRRGGSVSVFGSNGEVGRHDEALTTSATIVVGRKGSYGEVAFSPTPCWPIDTAYYIDESATAADLRWLSYRLRALGLNRLNRSAAVPGLNREDAYRQSLMLPPLPEQRLIADILDKADALRAQRRAALAELDTLTQSIFLDLFGDPIENPKGVRTSKLLDACARVTDGTHQSPKWSVSGHPFLFISNIITGEINFDTQRFVSDETQSELTRRCPIELGDVLYSTVGSYGVPAVVRTTKKFAFQRHIAHIKPRPDMLDSEFLSAMLASPPLKRQADKAARGIAQKTVNLADIKEFLIFTPPFEDQRNFARHINAVEALKSRHRAALAELDILFASLQHRAFRGELTPSPCP